MVAKLGNMDDPLPQDSFEGVEEDEWVSLSSTMTATSAPIVINHHRLQVLTSVVLKDD